MVISSRLFTFSSTSSSGEPVIVEKKGDGSKDKTIKLDGGEISGEKRLDSTTGSQVSNTISQDAILIARANKLKEMMKKRLTDNSYNNDKYTK